MALLTVLFYFYYLCLELWLGLKEIATLTSKGQWELQINLEDYAGNHYAAVYTNFKINLDDLYHLSVNGYDSVKSTLHDSLSGHNGAPFSTSDNDNDSSSSNCAAIYKGAWWYTHCHSSNLNGFNYFIPDTPHQTTSYATGIIWRNKKNDPAQDYYFSWPKAEMKIKRVD